MTMRFIPQSTIVATDHTLRYLFAWFDFMRQASPVGPGWTVPRSSDGATTITDGSGSNMTGFNDLSQWIAATSISWFVLRSPDGLKEFLFNRYSASDLSWQIRYSPGANYIGGDITVIPTATDEVFYHQSSITSAIASVLHMGADDAAPYGWWAYMHNTGNFADQRGGMAWVPITDAEQPGDIDPYVFVISTTTIECFLTAVLLLETNNSTVARCVGIPPGQTGARTLPALSLRSQSGNVFPSDAAADDNGDDLSMPVPFGVRSALSAPQGFKGFSSFMQWNGVGRTMGETFAGRTRVSWGDVNFPWDGSVPLDT